MKDTHGLTSIKIEIDDDMAGVGKPKKETSPSARPVYPGSDESGRGTGKKGKVSIDADIKEASSSSASGQKDSSSHGVGSSGAAYPSSVWESLINDEVRLLAPRP